MKRLNKEFKINSFNNFNIKYGSTNYKNPEVIYILGNTYISPLNESSDFSKEIEHIRYTLKNSIRQYVNTNENFKKMFVFDFNIRESGLKQGKKSYFSFEIYLRQNDIKTMSEIEPYINTFILNTTNKIETALKNSNFSTHKNKKSC